MKRIKLLRPMREPPRYDVYLVLRERILTTRPEDLGVPAETEGREPWGVLMEMAYPDGMASLVAMGTGDASLYFSSGQGVLGDLHQRRVRQATQAFVKAARHYLSWMLPAEQCPLPGMGQARFYILTPDGVFTAEAGIMELIGRRHSLAPFFYAGQDVITGLRMATEKQ